MVGGNITIMCYWNGRMITGPKGLAYEGTTPKATRVNARIKFHEFMEKMFVTTGFDKKKFEIKITCRYPCNSNEYIALPVEDHDTLGIVFDVAKRPDINCLEFYLEAAPICNNNVSNSSVVVHDEAAQLLTQENLPEQVVGCSTSESVNYDSLPAGDCANISKETGASEAHDSILIGTNGSNNLFDDEDEVTHEEVQDEGSKEHRNAPVSEFINPELMNEGNVDVSFTNKLVDAPFQELYRGQKFATKKELQKAVKAFSIKSNQEYEVISSTPTVWLLKCKKAPECPWKLRAVNPKGASFFEITKYRGPHTCVSVNFGQDHVQLDSNFIADQVKAVVKDQILISIGAIQDVIFDKFGYKISTRKAWSAKEKATMELFGDWVESYKVLPRYMSALQQANPGTVVHWDKEVVHGSPQQEKLHRVFWAFGASIQGFNHCRPVLCVDGTHLCGKYGGRMLIAVSSDGNNQLFPLAFAIVEGDSTDSWGWFMSCIRMFVTKRRGICVVSDRHPGIVAAMNTPGLEWNEPFAYHRFCIRHITSDFKARFHGNTLENLVSLAANENQVSKFHRRMETIGNMNPEARRWLEELPFEKWALSHDAGRRYGIMTTNLIEIFDGVLKGARSLPITALVQLTFNRVNSYFAARRQFAVQSAASGQRFTPFADERICSNGSKASGHEVVLFDRTTGTFNIKTGQSSANQRKGGHLQVVKLQENSCTCQKWQILGFPCSHVMAACQFCGLDYKTLVQSWYFISTYERTWSPMFHPIPDEADWPPESEVSLLPNESLKRNARGRPKLGLSQFELDARKGEAKICCSLCKKQGHNKRKCPDGNALVSM